MTPLEVISVLEGDLFPREETASGSPGSLVATSRLWARLETAATQILSSLTLADLAREAQEQDYQAPMYSI